MPQTIDQQLADVRVRAEVLAARLVRKMQADLRTDGAHDREILGIRPPTLGETFAQIGRNFAAAFGVTGDSNVHIARARQNGKTSILDQALADVTRRHDEACDRIRAAWLDAGSHPRYHARQQDRLHAEWPTLARALDALITAPRPHR